MIIEEYSQDFEEMTEQGLEGESKQIGADDVLAVVISELESSTNAYGELGRLEDSLNYYLGQPLGNELPGRSQVISTDVADAIEWILPQIMEALTGNNEVVTFDPVRQGDELQAQLESEYVYDVIMRQNNGFILLHEFIKDALMQRNGVLKVFYEKEECTETESYTGLTQEQLQALVSQDGIEAIEIEQTFYTDDIGNQFPQFSVKVKITEYENKIRIICVPPEQFRINSDHNSISLDDARFISHITQRTVGELIEEGYDQEAISKGTNNDLLVNQYRFQSQGETALNTSGRGGIVGINEDQALVIVHESYLHLDINGDGKAEYIKVLSVGDYLQPVALLDIEEIDDSPWIGSTAILMSHKFQGLSLFDRLKQIQDQKTALWRSMLDNIYLQNNQRTIVVNPSKTTIEDLLTSRPGGLIRVDDANQVIPYVTPQISGAAMDMITYLDSVRTGRAGVSPEGAATQNNIGSKVGSEGVDRLMTAKEALVGLMVRVIAETGIKPLCIKVRELLCKHVDAVQDFQFRGQWAKINPSTWENRLLCSVRVGTGSGDKSQKLNAIRELAQIQAAIFQQSGQALVTPNNIYNTLNDFCKFSGLLGAEKYFVDPNSQQGQQLSQQAAQNQSQNQDNSMQMLAQAELEKTRIMAENTRLKAQNDAAKAQLDSIKAQLDSHQRNNELQFKYDQLDANTALELTKIEQANARNDQAMFNDNLKYIDGAFARNGR